MGVTALFCLLHATTAVIDSSCLRCVVTLVPSKVAGRKGGGERQGIKRQGRAILKGK